ncbi:glycosyltransferase family 4 protein, partial [Salmonella enterica]|nr:glycosyltransferase family 4 protein [Salmonella enterica]
PGGNQVSKIYFLKKYIEKNPHDVFHSHGITADVFMFFLNGIKISTIHNRLNEDYVPLFGLFKGNLLYYAHLLLLKSFTHLVACSEAVATKLYQSKITKNVSVIQNGVDINKFHPVSTDKKILLRKKYGFYDVENIYVYCGSLSQRKNVSFLLEHLSLGKNDRFIIIGDGPLFDSCKKSYFIDNRYIFTGKIESPLEYYQLSDFFVSASLSEGLPLALLEAVSAGCFLYVSDIPPHREVASLLKNNSIEFFSLAGGNNKLKLPLYISKTCDISDEIYFNISDEKMAALYGDLYSSLLT